jgi:hypothetical protein
MMFFLNLIAAGIGVAIGECLFSYLKGQPWWPDSVINGFLMGFAIDVVKEMFAIFGIKE